MGCEAASRKTPLLSKKKPQISTVTQVAGTNVQIFSSPQMVQKPPLPIVTGPVAVSFKHEDSMAGMAMGPVIVTAKEPYDAWLKIHGVPHTSRSGETRYLMPFGSKPDGRYNLGWATKYVAQEVAAHYGVALEEF